MEMMKTLAKLGWIAGLIFLIQSCATESSDATSWEYNNSDNGGFQKVEKYDQETGPGLVFIEGGSFTMGKSEQDVMYDWNNRAARVTVSSFYMDQTEVTNFHWVEYLYWISRAYNAEFPMVYKNALPDTLCWRSPLGFNEKYVDYYLRHPAYRDYPVVGVSWLQANDYCKWRTDRVNEYILVREGILEGYNAEATGQNTFNTESYLSGQHEGGASVPDLNPSNTEGTRKVKMEDGFMLPRYRLPTEAEWEFAARGGLDLSPYPWGGPYVRNNLGCPLANFKPMRGDYVDDGGCHTVPVYSYSPNDYGLYCMAGNAAEWTSTAFDESVYQFTHDMAPEYDYRAKGDDQPSMKRKVIRGGSWKDIGYFIQNGSRAYEYQDTSKSYIGFRCVMSYLGRGKNVVAEDLNEE